MTTRRKPSVPPKGLRAAAEKLLATTPRDVANLPVHDVHKLVHEMQVQQIELEMQNEELRRTQLENEQLEMSDITKRKLAEQTLVEARNYAQTLLSASPSAIITYKQSGETVSANEAAAKLVGTTLEYLQQQNFRELASWKESNLFAMAELTLATGKTQSFESKFVSTFGVEAWAICQFVPFQFAGEPHLLLLAQDITERRQAENFTAMSREVLQILNAPGPLKSAIQGVLDVMKRRTGFDAVGIRLQAGNDFPYYVQAGFSDNFLRIENSLVSRTVEGGLCRDKHGRVMLECTCGLVLSGQVQPDNPFSTPKGSIWTNDSSTLLDLPTAADPRLHPRNQCIHQGYASVALVPIRCHAQILGLIQFNDRRKGCFTIKLVEKLEEIATHLGLALLRKQAEEALRQSEERYRLSERATQDGLWDWNLLTDEEYLSPRWKEIIGLQDDEIPDHKSEFLKRVHPEDLPRVQAMTAEHLATNRRYEVEFRLRHKDGSYRWVFSRGEAVRDASGRPVRMVGSTREITERKRTERALKTISACDQALVHATSEPELLREICRVIVEQGGYRMVWVGFAENDEAKTMRVAAMAGEESGYLAQAKISWSETDEHGRGPTGIAMRTGRMTMCQDMRTDPNFAPWREAAGKQGYVSSMTLPLLHAGTAFGVLAIYAAEAQAFQPAEVALLTALSEDLAYGIQALRMRLQHQQAEEQIRRLTVFPELNPNPVMEFGPDGTLTYHNQSAQELSQALELSGVAALLPPRVDELVRQCLATNQPQLREEIVRGSHILSASFYPICKANTVHCYMGDITERRQMEKRMLQAQKMEAIGTLAGGIAHDFNNMLAALFGYAYLLQQDTVGNPLAQESVAEILTAANRAKELVQQILSFSRQREQKPQVIKLETIVNEALKFLRASMPASIKIEKELNAETPAVLADPTQIYQVTMNLATNALHAMEDEPGRLLVRLDPVRPTEPLLQAHPGLKPMLYARLTIADTGHGMDAKTLDRIFEPFFTTKPVGKGTGLGLAVVHGIVASHNGIITVESQIGQGTTFTLYFPAQAQAESLTAAAASAVPLGRGQKILVLDDEVALTSMLQKTLRRMDYQVTTSNSGGEAIRLVRENPAQFDLVITDLTMPEINGLEVARQLHALRPELPVILMSGYSVSADADSRREAGICESLQKPVSMSALAETVQRVLGKS